jgi:hypothetical protein
MTEHNITLAVGATKVLHTAGQYCDRDIVVTAENGDGYDKGYNDGIEAGRQAEYDAFWDSYQENGNRKDYRNAFSGTGWTDETYNPKYPIIVTYMGASAFTLSAITDTKVPIVFDTTNAGDTGVFAYCASLKTIPSLKVTEKANDYTRWFYRCEALETINFTADSVIAANISFDRSPLLNTTFVQSIIDHLKDLTGATAQTLTFHATVGGNMTEAQKTAISQKNWTLVY